MAQIMISKITITVPTAQSYTEILQNCHEV